MSMTRKESTKEVLKHPEMIEYCKANLFKITCPEECRYYDLCRALDYTNEFGTLPNYPYDH